MKVLVNTNAYVTDPKNRVTIWKQYDTLKKIILGI